MISVKYGCPIEHLETISSIVGESYNSFDVMHRDNNIYLIHAKNGVSVSNLRGPIVDIEQKAIVSKSAGERFDVVSNVISVDEDNKIHLTDVDGKWHLLTNYEVKLGYQGSIVRVFKYKGVEYWATSKTLHFQDKSWGNHSETFGDMWKQLKGPSGRDLFPEGVETSSHVYHFLMVHKHLQVASRFTVMNPGFIILINKEKTCWDIPDNCTYTPPVTMDRCTDQVPSPFVCTHNTCSVKEANEYLQYGLRPDLPIHSDPRLTNGEFVVIKCLDTGNIYQVNSVAYQYRSSLRIKPYLYDAFYEHFNAVLLSERDKKEANNPHAKKGIKRKTKDILTEQEFLSIYVPLKDSPYPIITPVVMDNIKWPIKNVSFAIKLIFKCFLYSLPPVLQEEYKHIYDDYVYMKRYVRDRIFEICNSNYYSYNNQRISTIIRQAKHYISMGHNAGNPEALEKSIAYLVDYEFTFSLISIYNYLKDNLFYDSDEDGKEDGKEDAMMIKFRENGKGRIPGYLPRRKHHVPVKHAKPVAKPPKVEITIINPV